MNYPAWATAALLILLAGCRQTDNSPTNTDPAPLAPGPAEIAAPIAPRSPGQVASSADKEVASNDEVPRLVIDPDGLRWFLQPGGASRALPFGMARADVLASIERVRGAAAKGINADCGAGPATFAGWPDGLSLLFQDGRFVGWGLDNRAKGGVATGDGLGIGSTRAALDEAIGPPLQIRETTLGTEFTAGGYHGLLADAGPGAKITDMWAGVSCVAR